MTFNIFLYIRYNQDRYNQDRYNQVWLSHNCPFPTKKEQWKNLGIKSVSHAAFLQNLSTYLGIDFGLGTSKMYLFHELSVYSIHNCTYK